MINTPKFFEVEHRWKNWIDQDTNKTINEFYYSNTELRFQENYIRGYQMWARLICDCFIPVLILLYLNIRIILALISSTRDQQANSRRRLRTEINLTLVLLCIVFIFFLCHAPLMILDVYEALMVDKIIGCQRLQKCTKKGLIWLPKNGFFYFLPKVSHLMQILNSSTNFIVYCLVGHDFRRELCETFGFTKHSLTNLSLRGSSIDDKEMKHEQFPTQGIKENTAEKPPQ